MNARNLLIKVPIKCGCGQKPESFPKCEIRSRCGNGHQIQIQENTHINVGKYTGHYLMLVKTAILHWTNVKNSLVDVFARGEAWSRNKDAVTNVNKRLVIFPIIFAIMSFLQFYKTGQIQSIHLLVFICAKGS